MVVLTEWSSRGNWRILSPLGSIQRWAEARNSPPNSPTPWRLNHPISPWNFTVTVTLPTTLFHPVTPPWHRCAEWSCTFYESKAERGYILCTRAMMLTGNETNEIYSNVLHIYEYTTATNNSIEYIHLYM